YSCLVCNSSVSFLDYISLVAPAPPDLHSFPTRRSSDLRRGAALRRGSQGENQEAEGKYRCADADSYADSPDAPYEPDWNPGYERDRKSTRLNSSHVSISYAVFCLKNIS